MGKSKIKSMFAVILAICFMTLAMITLSACGHTHTMEHVNAKEATCETAGNIEYWHCTDCNKNYDAEKDGKELANVEIAKKGHTLSHVEAVPATCEADGTVEYWTCTTCHKNYDAETNGQLLTSLVAPKLGHDMKAKYDYNTKKYTLTCSRCDLAPQTVDANTAEYPLLADSEDVLKALVAENSTQYIKLAENIEINNIIIVRHAINFDLNGKTLSYNYKEAANTYNFVFALNTSSSIKNGNIVLTSTTGEGTLAQIDGATALAVVNFENVNISCPDYGITAYGDVELNIKDCNIVAGGLAISNNNTNGPKTKHNITIDNSTIQSTDATALFASCYTTMKITNNSIITGKYSALNIMMGDITIDGASKLVATSEEGLKLRNDTNIGKSGTDEEGVAIVIRTNIYYDDVKKTNNLSLSIANDTVISDNNNVGILVYNCNDAKGTLAGVADKDTVVDQYAKAKADLANRTDVKYYVFNTSSKTLAEDTTANA